MLQVAYHLVQGCTRVEMEYVCMSHAFDRISQDFEDIQFGMCIFGSISRRTCILVVSFLGCVFRLTPESDFDSPPPLLPKYMLVYAHE